ncbi:hypothetical protein RRF57_009042 [Xylaria bambusicola]|uniref:F-box domain-containing protein n=1 Tax=Xylaria bambusicola TaxID=326684 RepID=A0AAN7UP23_9PEZI
MSQITQNSTRLELPVEILLDILPHLDEVSVINLATAHPDVFIGPSLNIFILDAKKQVQISQETQAEDIYYYWSSNERPGVKG